MDELLKAKLTLLNLLEEKEKTSRLDWNEEEIMHNIEIDYDVMKYITENGSTQIK